jgi:ADP-ribose pyrophosphatase
MKFKTLESKEVYRGRRIVVLRDRVRYPDGVEREYDVVAHPGAVTMVPVDGEGNIWLIEQYRYAIKETLLELPAGTLEPDEAPEVSAMRELREEIGVAADRLEKIGELYLAPGYSTEFMHFYLATDLREAPLEKDAGEYIEVVKFPADEVFRMIAEDKIRDGKTIAGLALVRPYITPHG